MAAGDGVAARALVDELTAIIALRAARALRRRRGKEQRDVAQEVQDLSQHVLLHLFAESGRVLAQWDASRASLPRFVSVIADREIASILRSRRRSPWGEQPTELIALAELVGDDPGPAQRLEASQALDEILTRARARLGDRGERLLEWIVIERCPVDEVCARSGLSPGAVYAWTSRLRKLLRELAEEIDTPGVGPLSEPGSPRRME